MQAVAADPVADFVYFSSMWGTVERWHVLTGAWGRVANFYAEGSVVALEADELRSSVWVSLQQPAAPVRRITAPPAAFERFLVCAAMCTLCQPLTHVCLCACRARQ